MKEVINLFGDSEQQNELLRDKFIEPPFSVLNAKGEAWQNRKRAWKALGIKSEIGREGQLLSGGSGNTEEQDKKFSDNYGRKISGGAGIFDNATSVFDPSLTELLYRWFCPDGGRTLDVFAGGSVRGIVANYIGLKYTGIELRQEQVDSNREQALEILPVNNQPQWYVGDSEKILDGEWPELFDFMLSCPPYLDLEVYSDNESDLSTMTDMEFERKYQRIISKTFALLRPGAYACFVVGDVRDKKGFYRAFPEMTVRCFLNAGYKLYNKAVLTQPLGTAMLRANRVFESGKKLIKVHEDILIFKKP